MTNTQTNWTEYGDPTGTLVIYFHGTPGAPAEAALFDQHAKTHHLRVACLNRGAMPNGLDRTAYFAKIAEQVRDIAQNRPVAVVGFSIGAHVALEVIALLPNQVRHVHLIAAAAPLAAGDFLPNMAGASVFKLARDKPTLFARITRLQQLLALLAPGLLRKLLFASACGADRQLRQQPTFKAFITPLLKNSIGKHCVGYMRDIFHYVNASDAAAQCHAPVTLWHGEADNWSPIAMAHYLTNAIPSSSHVETLPGLSHYSCLFAAAEPICEQLKRQP